MLPDNLRGHAVAAAVADFDPDAVVSGTFERSELTLEIASEKIGGVCRFLKQERQFVRLCTVTGVDRYPREPRFEVVYHLHSIEHHQRVRLKCRLPGDNPEIESVTSVWRGANWFERETFDLFGIRFRNHPDLRRIMMPEDWEGYPLRKDYPVTGKRYET
jgi:NADH-quinone oxidoreductase subunit C